jgi:hypothetical protein
MCSSMHAHDLSIQYRLAVVSTYPANWQKIYVLLLPPSGSLGKMTVSSPKFVVRTI